MIDVLVVGAGPVGMTAALELARRGLAVRIVERRSAPSAESRAIGINPRTLDILEPAGVTPRILDEGIKINRARLISRGQSVGTVKFSAVEHRYPFMLALPQSRTEAILEHALADRGVRVERNIHFVRNGGTAAAPIAVLESQVGQETVACSRLLGCDGVNSAVRADAGIAFEGQAYEHKWSLMDAEVDWPYPPDEVCFSFSGRGNLFVLPVTRGVWRLVVPGETLDPALPDGVTIGKVFWRSQFRIAHRLAACFAASNVFLAGDSAHVHSPAGARGMNGGIEDAATFAWLASIDALDRYEAMRRPAAQRIMGQVDRQSRQAQATGHAMLLVREVIARALLRLPSVQRLAAGLVTAQDSAQPEWLV